ncbi:MAG: FHA domain-containing protein [Polyangiaceae bacterium]|jgi:pSer/pThr/pTyr-binding forkhead associated (FHA) protein|nr:FHA domain-containing protein [Polyangiaceae bacterium]
MWKLTIEDDEGTKTLLPLVRDEYHIGRDEQNTIRLTERNVSRRHASLKKENSAWHIVDHGSYNGCYVNGQRVAEQQPLRHSDIIQLGDYRIFVTSDAADAESTGPNPVQAQAAMTPQEKPDRLVVVAGPAVGAEFPLGDTPMSLGRAEECGISINHPSVSRFHAEIRPIGKGRFEITDKGSSNGIRVNTIDFRRTLLEHGDLIELGDVRLRFVERGQFYRPQANMTMQLSAITGKELLPSDAPPPKTRTGVVIGAVAAGILVLVGLVVVSMSSNAKDPAAATPDTALTADDGHRALLEAAKKADSVGDHEGAVNKLAEIPVNSPLRQAPEFISMHDRWAEKSIAKAAELVDKSEKKTLLNKVAQNTNVNADLRRKAADAMASLDAPGTDPNQLPLPRSSDPKAPGDPTAKLVPKKTDDKKDPGATPASTPTTAPPSAPPDANDTEMKQRRALEGRMNSGKATKDDLRLLKEICKHQGDAACKARVQEALKKLQ